MLYMQNCPLKFEYSNRGFKIIFKTRILIYKRMGAYSLIGSAKALKRVHHNALILQCSEKWAFYHAHLSIFRIYFVTLPLIKLGTSSTLSSFALINLLFKFMKSIAFTQNLNILHSIAAITIPQQQTMIILRAGIVAQWQSACLTWMKHWVYPQYSQEKKSL